MDDLDLALEYAEHHPNFDAGFIHSLAEALEKYGSLTNRQADALHNIVEKFRMHEWRDRH